MDKPTPYLSSDGDKTTQRTRWAEIYTEHFVQVPLTAEFVFRSPKYLPANKELCDHLLMLRDDGIVVLMKCQEDPTVRSGNTLRRWAAKAALGGIRQAKVAIQRLRKTEIYCDHPRRGRVDSKANSIMVSHAVVLIEAFESVELPEDLSLDHGGIPVTYLSVNDFLNLIDQLRAYPDIKKYLNARRILPAVALRTIGFEIPLYKYYLMNEGSFAGCLDIRNAVQFLAVRKSEVNEAIHRKSEADRPAHHIEYVCNALAKRHPEYRKDLDPDTLAMFDDSDRRRNYLLLQENLCDLSLSDRRMLGMQFEKIIRKAKEGMALENFCYAAAWTDSKPDFVYVFVSSRGVSRAEILRRSETLLLGSLAHYHKNRGMFIADRDGASYEVGLFADVPISSEIREIGERYFGKLRIADYSNSLLP